jgi:ABC-type spermidine/putrescine transport system permease subunit I
MKKQKSKWKRALFIIGMLTPAMLLSLGIIIYPIINTMIQSFQDPETGAFTFANYQFLFTDKVASATIWFTVEISLLTVLFSIALSYLLALFLRFSHSKISKWIGNLYLIPRFIPGLVAVYAMMTIVRDSGLLHRISMLFPAGSVLYDLKPGLLYNMKGILMMNLWFNIPFATMIITAALSGISESTIESARDVGAGPIKTFFSVILPLSYKDVLIAATFVFMSNISSFTTPYLIGPNFPLMMGVYLRNAFSNRNYELAAATSVVIFLFSSISAIVYLYTNMKNRAWENSGN